MSFSVRTNEEIVSFIVKGDGKAFDVDVLKSFIKLLPDNTEVSNGYQYLNFPYYVDVLASSHVMRIKKSID